MIQSKTLSSRMKQRMRKRLISGLVILVPLGFTIFFLKFLFDIAAGLFKPVFTKLYAQLHPAAVYVLSLGAFLLLLYVIGMLATDVVGRRLIALAEKLIGGIPFVKTIYSTSKQVTDFFSVSNRSAFNSVALVEFPRPGMKAIGFVTGTIEVSGSRYYKVFIPTTPNPTTGFFELVSPEQAHLLDIEVEEAVKMLISGGILAPERLSGAPAAESHEAPAPGPAAERETPSADAQASAPPEFAEPDRPSHCTQSDAQ